ncbi:hypothetical protein PTT_10451 [Pyrenophora teres f. teres 0-1]|uniref:Uncharacterized protein n=1 Tax=Pyrenophora teres f. teres (strain 0-1) TaxID=861557 RepID=E3RPA0_PYRTT|nr:hypothetical protein PTT_10451 [Pyrenophora teres f. teres 0-1]
MPPKRSSDRSTGPKKRVKNSSASQLSQPDVLGVRGRLDFSLKVNTKTIYQRLS